MKPILPTGRLTLVPFESHDLALLHRTFTDPFVRKYLWDDEIISLEQTRDILQTNDVHFEKDGWGLWQIRCQADDTYAGVAGLWLFFGEDQPQLLYGLLPDQTKKGYATEASRAVIRYAFEQLSFSYLVAACDTPNTDSRKVCGRLHLEWVEEKEMKGRPTAFYRLEAGTQNQF
jgi:[ribosomal protein S5]-alanine N-acetyltransferase